MEVKAEGDCEGAEDGAGGAEEGAGATLGALDGALTGASLDVLAAGGGPLQPASSREVTTTSDAPLKIRRVADPADSRRSIDSCLQNRAHQAPKALFLAYLEEVCA